MTRDELIAAVEKLPGAQVPRGYYINSDEPGDHPDHGFSFCYEHAHKVARIDVLLEGASVYVSDGSWGETDGCERCQFYGCGIELDTGSLTDYGVDNSLALTESDPLACSVTPYELKRSAWALADDDPRWETWDAQAIRALEQHRRAPRRRAA